MTTRPHTFPNGTSYWVFIESNCEYGCVHYNEPEPGTRYRCPILNNLELEQWGEATPARLAFIDKYVDGISCNRIELERKPSLRKLPITKGQEVLELCQ